LALLESFITAGEIVGNTVGGSMSSVNLWEASMRTSITETMQNHGQENLAVFVLVSFELYNLKHIVRFRIIESESF